MTKTSAIKKAVEAAGGQTALAKKIKVSQGLVWQWLDGSAIHTRHFEAIEAATGVTAQELLADEMHKAQRTKRQPNRKRAA